MNKIKIKEVLLHLDKYKIEYKFIGSPCIELNYVYPTFEQKNHGLSFYTGDDLDSISNIINFNSLIILKKDVEKSLLKGNIIYVENPSLCFNIVGWLFKPKREKGIHETAIIGNKVVIGKNFNIGAYSVICNGVKIGDNVDIGENCVVKNSKIGNDVRIQTGAKIGSMGLGSYMRENGEWVDFPHFGSVAIEDNVVIQDNAVINRGTLTDTVIGKNSRIGPLCWIAHGVIIGNSCFVSQAVTVAGSVKVGAYTKIWGNASIRDGVSIGRNCTVGMGAVVVKNIPDNETYIGNPARKIIII
jgi:UDP-3-O-[3-hydroxymyristoyl] glucosamine N-acyltransferase